MSALDKIFDKVEETHENGKRIPNAWAQSVLATMGEWRASKAELSALRERVEALEHLEAVAQDVNEWLKTSANLKGTAHQRSLEAALKRHICANCDRPLINGACPSCFAPDETLLLPPSHEHKFVDSLYCCICGESKF